MQPWSREFTGRIDELEIESEALRGNALGDPNVRPLWVYVPPGYDDDPERRFPCVYVIQGLTGQLDMWRNREPFRATYPESVDALFVSGEAPPTLVTFVDCWTSLGGSQFLDSPGTGRAPAGYARSGRRTRAPSAAKRPNRGAVQGRPGWR